MQDRHIRHAITSGAAQRQLMYQLANTNTDNPNPAFHTHLIALRPDYAFWNIANVFGSFFDPKINTQRPSIIL